MTSKEQHQQIIEEFYTAFQQLDAEKMVAYYDDAVIFEDPAFGQLEGDQAKDMWRMLIERGKSGLRVTYSDVVGTAEGGTATWEARYLFGRDQRPVHNIVNATFIIRDQKIVQHHDSFNFWRWAGMAMGTPGKLLGFTSYLQNKVKKNTRTALEKYRK